VERSRKAADDDENQDIWYRTDMGIIFLSIAIAFSIQRERTPAVGIFSPAPSEMFSFLTPCHLMIHVT